MLSVNMPSVIMQSIVMLNVVIQSVVAPSELILSTEIDEKNRIQQFIPSKTFFGVKRRISIS